jgi:photosystem II stability/assembly factor-like uncharacterized protein
MRRGLWFWLALSASAALAQPLDELPLHTPIECHPSAHTGKWVNLGPFQTTPRGPNLGQIHAMAVHPSDTNVIYVGAPNGGIWKTTDGGKHWRSLMNIENMPPIGIRSILINPHNTDVVVAATAAGQGIWAAEPLSLYGVGVIVSFDAGETWQSTKLRFDPTGPMEWYGQIPTFKLVMLPRSNADETWLLAMTKNQLYRVSIMPADRESEESVALLGGVYDPGSFRDFEIHPAHPDTIWVSSFKGLYRSYDGGASWDTLSSYLLPGPGYSQLISCPFEQTNIKAMFVEYKLNRLYLFDRRVDDSCENEKVSIQYSTDFGDTWTGLHISKVPINTGAIFAISESDSSVYVRDGITHELVRKNLRLEPKTMSSRNTHIDPRGFLVFNFDGKEILYLGNDGGINVSTDHITWRDITGTGLGMSQHYGIGCDPNDAQRLIAGAQDGSINFYNNGTWQQASGGDNGDALFHPRDTNAVFFSSNNTLLRSTNGGRSFAHLKSGDGGSSFVLFPMALHPQHPDTMMVGFKRLWRSNQARTGAGSSFYEIHSPHGDRFDITSIEIGWANPNLVYHSFEYYHYNGGDSTIAVLFRASDGGAGKRSWKDITGSLGRNVSHGNAPLKFGPIHDITSDPEDPSRVWVCFGGFGDGLKVFYSSDTGNTWQNVSSGLPNLPANTIVYQRGSHDRLYLGMDGGVYYWEADSSGWYRYCGGFPNVNVHDLDIQECAGMLRVATYGRGVWEVDLIPPEPMEIRGVTTWSGSRTVTQDIHVRKKSTLIIMGTLNMTQGRSITLSKRATLIVDGGKVTNSCDCKWDGIVHGKRSRVEVRNGGLIEMTR